MEMFDLKLPTMDSIVAAVLANILDEVMANVDEYLAREDIREYFERFYLME